ncbi:MAG: hypothetical protein AABZ58_03030 [Chloroflexota bacterium]
MTRLTSSQFMHALPAAAREHLPPHLQKFRAAPRGWLCQLYYRDPRLHYEVWNLGERRGLLEIGLHFESREREVNEALLRGFFLHMIEVKATLGPGWEAEYWDRGWTKVYETIPHEPFSTALLEKVSKRLARAMTVLTPIWEDVQKR